MKHRIMLVSLVLMAGVALSFCAPAPALTPTVPATSPAPSAATAAPPTAPSKGAAVTEEMVVGNRGDIDTLDPGSLSNINNYPVADNVYNFLVSYKTGTAELQPELATKWDISPDGLTYTFSLRQGVKFHKGYGEFTADDVKCQFERILNPDTKALWATKFGMISKIEAVDKYTVRFTLKTPYAPFLSLLGGFRGGPIASCKAVKERGKDYALDPIGSGPFVFEKWTPKSEVVLVRNEEYWGELAKVKRVRIIPIADDTVAAAAIEKGEISMRYFRDPVILANFEKNPNLVIERKPQFGIWALYYKTDKPPFDNIKVRQAVSYAINRTQIVKFVLTNAAEEAVSFLGPLMPESTKDVTIYNYDPQKAKQLLAEAGYPNGFEVDFLTTDLAPWPLVNPVIKDNLEAVGIKVKMRQLEQATYRGESTKGNYDLTAQGVTDVPDPDSWAYSLFDSHSIGSTNYSRYQGADDLIEKARVELDPAKRKSTYVELQKKLASDAAFVPLFHLGSQLVRWKNVQGASVAVLNDFPLDTVYIQK